jgi:general secretion pathway protein A
MAGRAREVTLDVYETYFGLREKPFSLTPDPRFLFLSAQHRGALDHLLYGVARREGFLAITGDVGTGKTTICRALLERLDAGVRTALILNPLCDEDELLKAILQDFEIQVPARASRKQLVDCLNGFLLEQARRGGGAVLIIDEAQNLAVSVLEQIRILSNLETDREKLLQIVLVGQRELRDKLESPALTQLNQRISIRYHLSPLSREESVRYIEHRLTVAGAKGGITFSPEAHKAIYQFSSGVPRLVNLIADRALLVLEGRRSLTGEEAPSSVFRPRALRQVRSPLSAAGVAFLGGVLCVALMQWAWSGGVGAMWSGLGARLSAPLVASSEVASLPERGVSVRGIPLPLFRPEAGFPYAIRARPGPDGEGLRATLERLEAEEGLTVFAGEGSVDGWGHVLLIGRFKTPEEAEWALRKVSRLGGLAGIEIIDTARPRAFEWGR